MPYVQGPILGLRCPIPDFRGPIQGRRGAFPKQFGRKTTSFHFLGGGPLDQGAFSWLFPPRRQSSGRALNESSPQLDSRELLFILLSPFTSCLS